MYIMFSEKPLGESCQLATDCRDPAAICSQHSNICTCDQHHYDRNGLDNDGNCQPGKIYFRLS